MKFRDFFKIFKILSHFGENLDKTLENLEICICRGFGGGALDACEFMESCNFWIVLMVILPFFNFLRISSNLSRKLRQ